MLEKIIVALISGIAKSIELGREAAADTLEQLATKIRAGALIPDDAFYQAQADLDRFDDLKEHLSGEDDQS